MNKPLQIHIIDDDPITRFGLKKILMRDITKATISEFKNGNLALLALKHQLESNDDLPDILFLDINMPVMDGWSFLEALLELPIAKRMLINILTSSIDPADDQKFEFYKTTFQHHLTFVSKPILKVAEENIFPSKVAL